MREYEIYIVTKFHRYMTITAESLEEAKAKSFELMADGLDPCEEADVERRVFVEEKEA